MLRSLDLCRKEVINIRTAERLGYIDDVDIDSSDGKIISIVIPKRKIFFLKRDDYIIPWESIILVGRDLILVDYCDGICEIQ